MPGAVAVRSRAVASPSHLAVPTSRSGWDRTDALITVALIAGTYLVHPVGAMMARPYWVDEAWVASLTRVPFGQSMALSSSTPVGWLALLRWMPGGTAEGGRALTLAFAMLTSGAAYVLARGLAWRTRGAARFAGIVVAVVVSCVPIALLRNDLKQYTADAFFALVLLIITRAVDADSPATAIRRLGVAAVIAVPFSSTSAFVSIACFAGLLASSLAKRDRARVRTTLLVGGATAVGMGSVFAVTVLSHVNPQLTDFWRDKYLTGGPLTMLHGLYTRLGDMSGGLAMPSFLFLALLGLGVAALLRLRSAAVAIAIPFLWVEMMLAARFDKYPFLDRRTFHFVLIPTVAAIAVGVVWTLLQLARRSHIAGLVATLLVAGLFARGVAPHWRDLGIPQQDIRTQVEVVARDATPEDVILVSYAGGWGFAYYWPRDPVFATKDEAAAAGFAMNVRNPNVVIARGRDEAGVLDALREALALQRQTHPDGRIFIVRTHLTDRTAWSKAVHALGLHPRQVLVGEEQLLLVVEPTNGSQLPSDPRSDAPRRRPPD